MSWIVCIKRDRIKHRTGKTISFSSAKTVKYLSWKFFLMLFNSKVHTHDLYDDYKYDIALLGMPYKNLDYLKYYYCSMVGIKQSKALQN